MRYGCSVVEKTRTVHIRRLGKFSLNAQWHNRNCSEIRSQKAGIISVAGFPHRMWSVKSEAVSSGLFLLQLVVGVVVVPVVVPNSSSEVCELNSYDDCDRRCPGLLWDTRFAWNIGEVFWRYLMSKPWPIFVGTKEAVVAGNLTVRDDRLDDYLFTLVGANTPTKAGTLSQRLNRICEQARLLVGTVLCREWPKMWPCETIGSKGLRTREVPDDEETLSGEV